MKEHSLNDDEKSKFDLEKADHHPENEIENSGKNEVTENNDNVNNNMENKSNGTNQDIDSKIKKSIPTNFEVLIEIKEDKIIDNDANVVNESLGEMELDLENEQSLENSNTQNSNDKSKSSVNKEKENEKEKELLDNIMKYFSIIESSLDTLYLFSVHLNEEGSKDHRNNSMSKIAFNPKIVKRIVNYGYQLKDSSDDHTSILRFVQIIENM